MGLFVHSLKELPITAERSYYLYLLNGGWAGPLERSIEQNYHAMSDMASRNDAIVIQGCERWHFQNEVFSWHHLNGEEAETLLPAILLTTIHPSRFANESDPYWQTAKQSDHLVLIPLKDHCNTGDEVVTFIRKVFEDIKSKKALIDFQVVGEMSPNRGKAFLDGLVLRPTFMGVGFDLKTLPELFRRKKR
ncbi:hypothetical protein DES53_102896 [Roseimicrobium gellanilyticum]|uniref:Uncharacterized protein n=1 Tax=Roseimicrobium gellanilyticum TaxID=748857 RepID=A0A366HS45_9BACT|nr:hypothetical protein [Roseimicrobium gellanilyticum]RBP46505.1 hypothetical protein DES53_102896 [Roseimicrobium gellanilyticum]